MALTILSNLSYNGKNPNFERDRVATLKALLNVNPANQEYDYGHIVFCEEDGKHYRFMYKYGAPDYSNYNETTTGWFKEFVAEGTGGGSIDTSNLATKDELNAKQDAISDLGTIRSGAAKGATSVQEIQLNNDPVAQPTYGKITISESDPVFKASAAANITDEDIEAWNNKGTVTGVKINGTAGAIDANGVVDLGYIDSGSGDTIINGVTDVTVGGASVVSNNKATIPNASTSAYGVTKLTDAINKDDSSLAATAKAVSIINANKQDKISDLETIRTDSKNAFKGTINGANEGNLWLATKVNGKEPNGEGEVTIDVGDKNVQSDWNATSGDAFIKNKPTIPAAVTESTVTGWGFTKNTGTYSKPDGGIPTTDLANDVQEKINKADNAFTGSINGSKNGGFFTVEKIVMNNNDYKRNGSETHIDLGTVLTEHQDISGKLDISEAASTYATKLALSEGLANKANIADIPDEVTEEIVSGWGFTKNTGDYSKPTGGIPISDLDSNVQTILGKANMTIDRIVMNGVDYAPSGSETHIDLGTVITGDDSVQHILGGLVVGSDTTPSAMQDGKHLGRVVLTGVDNPLVGLLDNSDGAVPFYLQTYKNELYVGQTRGKAIKIDSNGKVTVQKSLVVTDSITESGTALSNKYQAKLVSGTNIKTINGESILGGGNIITNAYPLVNHGTSDTTFELTPNVFHVWSNVASLSLTLGSGTNGVANEYLFQFSCLGGQATTLGLPSGIQWANGEVPTLEVMKTYQVSILNNCATIQSFG